MYVLRTSAIAPIAAITSMTTTSLKSCFRASMTKIESISRLNNIGQFPMIVFAMVRVGMGTYVADEKYPYM